MFLTCSMCMYYPLLFLSTGLGVESCDNSSNNGAYKSCVLESSGVNVHWYRHLQDVPKGRISAKLCIFIYVCTSTYCSLLSLSASLLCLVIHDRLLILHCSWVLWCFTCPSIQGVSLGQILSYNISVLVMLASTASVSDFSLLLLLLSVLFSSEDPHRVERSPGRHWPQPEVTH